MLKRVVITNYLGESMEYLIDGVQVDNPSGLIITSIDGLGPVKADINMTELTTTDGGLFNSARLSARNIVISAIFTHASSIEEARLLSYKYFPIKKKVKVRVETDNRIGETEGYVESNEPDIFSEESSCQISILCENPYFDGGKIGYTFGDTIPLFKFQFGNEDLEEPLIKLSEEAEVSSVREIVYEGDTDAGMEIAVEVPSDDIMDTFKVTGIEIQGDKGSIKIDTSKMVSQVPNSAPNNTNYRNLVFFYDSINRIKYITSVPVESGVVNYGYSPVAYGNNLHIISRDTKGKHYMLQGKEWVLLDSLPNVIPEYSSYDCWLLTFENAIHLFIHRHSNHSGGHYLWTEETGWQLADDSAQLMDKLANVSSSSNRSIEHAVVYGNTIHLIGHYGATNNFTFFHWKLASNHTEWVDVSSGVQTLNKLNFDYATHMIVYDGAIHVFGASTRVGHYSWKEGQPDWSLSFSIPSVYAAGTSGGYDQICKAMIVVFNDELHILGGQGTPYSSDDPLKDHYKYNGLTLEWEQLEDLPVYYNVYGSKTENVANSNYIYICQNAANGTYTEEANNIKLIENDKLVINTIKGKKGVTLYRGTNSYNVLNSLDRGSTWLQLQRGVNRFSYSAEEGADDMQITISTNKWYEGV